MKFNPADNLKKKGAAANPNGRPKGKARTTCIREAIENIFKDEKNESLEQFMQALKKAEPVEFVKVMARLAPQKINSHNTHSIDSLSESDSKLLNRALGGKDDVA